MSTRTRIWLAGAAMVALGISLYLTSPGSAGGDKAIRTQILKIAAALETGDAASAKSLAAALAKNVEDIGDVMNLFKLRTKKGLVVGTKPGAIQPDGIELQLNKMGRDEPSQGAADKGAEALEKMAYIIGAIGEVAIHKPHKDEPKKKQNDWVGWAKELSKAAPGLAKAAKLKSPAELRKASAKINSGCSSCQSVFK